MKIIELTNYLESLAPLAYQESYDNCGLNIGEANAEIESVLVTLDVTLAVVEEAIEKKCNLIIAHHPLIFKGLKNINGKNYVEQIVIKAIKNDIAIYAIHTNLDNAIGGVNFKIAEKLALNDVKILSPKINSLMKLTVFVPKDAEGKLINALHAAGAGQIGNYTNCSFMVEGTGTFKPNEHSNPVIGTKGKLETLDENRIEVIFAAHLKNQVLNAMYKAHPYEEVAYYLHILENENQDFGSGAVGDLKQEMQPEEFLAFLKDKLNVRVIKHTAYFKSKIKKVAVCGGVGSFLLNNAKKAQADVFVTADYKYHEFFDAQNDIIIADIGHYESEQFTKDLIVEKISKKFTNFATYLSEIETNPIKYYY